jgi:acetolactate synthase-1/2/3 large subunit
MTADAGKNTAEVMAEALLAAGVRRIFAYPGDPIIEFMEQCRVRDLDVVLASREGSAGFMAEALAMTTGGVGACLSTLGPGSTALVNSVAAATLDRVPVIAISGQIETARQAVFTHQVVDHERLYSPITKWAGTVTANAAASIMRRALRLATAERPGAVHLSCAADTFRDVASDAEVITPPLGPGSGGVQVVNASGSVAEPVELLRTARRPLLLVGIGAVRCNATQAAVALAQKVGMPVVVAPMAKGVVPEDFDWFAGVLDMACNVAVWEFLAKSDLIVAAGFDPVELIKPWALATPVLHIDTTPNTDQVYRSDVEMVGDVAGGLLELAEGYDGQSRWTEQEVTDFRAELRDAYYAGRVGGRLNPTDVVDAARDAFSADTVVTTDVGSHKLLVGQGWTATVPRSVLMTNGLSSMGFGVPAAVAAKLAHPSRPVLALVGDGGFAMTATELRHAAAMGLGITVVVFVDGSLNRIELKQAAMGYASTATRIEDIDIVKLVEALGCDAERADSVASLERCLAAGLPSTRPRVIEARIDPSQYTSQF